MIPLLREDGRGRLARRSWAPVLARRSVTGTPKTGVSGHSSVSFSSRPSSRKQSESSDVQGEGDRRSIKATTIGTSSDAEEGSWL